MILLWIFSHLLPCAPSASRVHLCALSSQVPRIGDRARLLAYLRADIGAPAGRGAGRTGDVLGRTAVHTVRFFTHAHMCAGLAAGDLPPPYVDAPAVPVAGVDRAPSSKRQHRRPAEDSDDESSGSGSDSSSSDTREFGEGEEKDEAESEGEGDEEEQEGDAEQEEEDSEEDAKKKKRKRER